MNKTEQLKAMFEAVLRTSKDLENSYNQLKEKFNKLEIKLENNRRYLENILESINTGVCSVDMNCRITMLNREAFSIFEITEGAVKGSSLDNLFKLGVKNVTELIKRFKQTSKLEIVVNNITKTLSISASPITDNNIIVGAVIIISDVTRIEELEEENRKKEKLAIIGQMAASIAHDIKNPLASIELLVSLLSDDSKKEIADNIMISIKRINNIINNTLLFTKTVIFRPEHFNSIEFVEDIEVEIFAHIKSKNIAFEKDIEDFGMVTDKNLLKSAVVNLLVNAIEAAESRVTIKAYKNKHTIFEVLDDGCGIDTNIQKRIFEPFYTNKKSGTGLGLSIVNKAVNIMDGKLEFDTGKNGTSFRIIL